MELIPGIRMLHIVFRAVLSRHIIVADHLLRSQPVSSHQPGHKLRERLVSGIRKLSGLVCDAALNGDRILISVIGWLSNLVAWNTLHNFSVYPNNKMTARISLAGLCKTFEIAAVLFCRCPRVRCVMHDNPIDL